MTLFDLEVERSYLTSVSMDPERLDRYGLRPEQLYSQDHAAIMRAVLSLREQHKPIDFISISAQLDRNGERLEDATVLHALGGDLATVRSSFERLTELASLRDLREKLLRASMLCDERKLTDALAALHVAADEARNVGHRRILSSGEVAERAIQVLGLLDDNAVSRLVPTGINALDETIGGLDAGDLLTFGAQTNVGKSWTLLTMATRIATTPGQRMGIVSLEDPAQQWGARLLAICTGISSNSLRSRKLSREDYRAIAAAPPQAAQLGFELSLSTGANVHQVMDAMRSLVKDRGCTIVAIDYGQALHGVETSSEHLALKRMYTMLKGCADRLGIPLVMMSQIKRGDNPDAEPNKYALKEGGDLELKSEYVVMMWRDRDSPQLINAKLDKSKVGGNGLRWSWAQLDNGTLTELATISFRDAKPANDWDPFAPRESRRAY